jgi:hypothetical protein
VCSALAMTARRRAFPDMTNTVDIALASWIPQHPFGVAASASLTSLFTGKISETCLTSSFEPKGSANVIAAA